MLSRAADSLFWMSRYVERAENMARLVDVGRRVATIPRDDQCFGSDWRSILAAAGCAEKFDELHADKTSPEPIDFIAFLILDENNPSSVAACFNNARANARAARTGLTVEMWEALNDAWNDMRQLRFEQLRNGELSGVLERIKRAGALFRGATDSSALRSDGFDFLRLGVYIERFDTTARLLDVNSEATAKGGDVMDPYRWEAVLRAAGVVRAYQSAYRAEYDARNVVDFLALNQQCPRSLRLCASRIALHLDHLAATYERRSPCNDHALALRMAFTQVSAETILNGDFRGFLGEMIRRNNEVSLAIAESFYFTSAPMKPKAPIVEAEQMQTQGVLAPKSGKKAKRGKGKKKRKSTQRVQNMAAGLRDAQGRVSQSAAQIAMNGLVSPPSGANG